MDTIERKKIEQEIRDLVIALTQYGDHREAEKAVALFAEDGFWLRGGKPYKGRAEILDSYKRGSQTQVTRHMNGGMLITIKDDNHAECVTYYIALHHDPKVENPKFPLPFDPPFSMGEWHDKFIRTTEGWRFASRETKRLFERQGGH
jgi:SnoaL-like domain